MSAPRLGEAEHRQAARAVGEIIRAYQAGDEETMIEILEVVNLGTLVVFLVGMLAELGPKVHPEFVARLIGECEAQPR